MHRQIIIPMNSENLAKILSKSAKYITNINNALRSIKSYIIVDFIHSDHRGLIITTNNVMSVLDLNTVKKYIKSIDSIWSENVLSPCLLQSKSYLKILGIPYYDCISKIPINSNLIEQVIQLIHIFNNICLTSKPHVIKAFSKLDMAVVWINIWDSQSGMNAKGLINRLFNIGSSIATVHGTNMNLGVL